MKYFPEFEEIQKGHTQQHKQGLWSTKELNDISDTNIAYMPQPRSGEICINIEDMKHIMCTYKTGKFPVVSSKHGVVQSR